MNKNFRNSIRAVIDLNQNKTMSLDISSPQCLIRSKADKAAFGNGHPDTEVLSQRIALKIGRANPFWCARTKILKGTFLRHTPHFSLNQLMFLAMQTQC